MALPDKNSFSLNTFLKDLRKKVCGACSFIKRIREIVQKPPFYIDRFFQERSTFTKREGYFPHIHPG